MKIKWGIAKHLVVLLFGLTAITSYAVDSSIYIDQAGDNATITVNQDGSNNRVRGIQGAGSSNTTPAKVNGPGVVLDINQVGANNTLNLGIDTATAAGGTPTSVTYSVTGGNNTGTINLNNAGTGTNESTLINVSKTGGNNTTGINILGSKNSLTATMTGGSATLNSTVNASETTQTITSSGGTSNSVTTNLTSNKGTVGIVLVGASNTVSLTQSGVAGTTGHSTVLDVNGSTNTYGITQSGTIDTTVNLKTTGSGNSYTINTQN